MAVRAAINSEVARFVGLNLAQNKNLIVFWRSSAEEDLVNILSTRLGKVDLDVPQLTIGIALLDMVQKKLDNQFDSLLPSDTKDGILAITGSTTIDIFATPGPRFAINYAGVCRLVDNVDMSKVKWSDVQAPLQAKIMSNINRISKELQVVESTIF